MSSPWLQRELSIVAFLDLPECVVGHIAMAGGVPLMASVAMTCPSMLLTVIQEAAQKVMHLRLCFDCLRVSVPVLDEHGCGCPGNVCVRSGIERRMMPVGHRLLMVLMCHLALDISKGWLWRPLSWIAPCTQHPHFHFQYGNFPPWLDLLARSETGEATRLRRRPVTLPPGPKVAALQGRLG